MGMKTSLEKWSCAISKFIVLTPSRSIRQTLAIFSGVEFAKTVSPPKIRKRKRKSLSCVHVLRKTWNLAVSRRSLAVTANKCKTRRDGGAELFFFSILNLLLFGRSRWRGRRRWLSSLISRQPWKNLTFGPYSPSCLFYDYDEWWPT